MKTMKMFLPLMLVVVALSMTGCVVGNRNYSNGHDYFAIPGIGFLGGGGGNNASYPPAPSIWSGNGYYGEDYGYQSQPNYYSGNRSNPYYSSQSLRSGSTYYPVYYPPQRSRQCSPCPGGHH